MGAVPHTPFHTSIKGLFCSSPQPPPAKSSLKLQVLTCSVGQVMQLERASGTKDSQDILEECFTHSCCYLLVLPLHSQARSAHSHTEIRVRQSICVDHSHILRPSLCPCYPGMVVLSKQAHNQQTHRGKKFLLSLSCA